MLELVHQEQTNWSIAWKIENHNFCFVNILIKKANSYNLGLGLTIHAGPFFVFAGQVLLEGYWPAVF